MKNNMLKPIARTTLTEDIVDQFINLIVQGDIKPGDRIPSERELAEQLGVGRTSLREALKSLEIMGLIEVRQGEGTFASNSSNFLTKPLTLGIRGNVRIALEFVEMRKLLETELAGYAAERGSDKHLEVIEKHFHDMEEHINDKDKFHQADIAFHLAIAEAGQNSLIYHVLYMLRSMMRHWIESALQVPNVNVEALAQHRALLDAIKKRDSKKARKAMVAHLDAMSEKLLSVIEEKSAERSM